VLQLFAVRKPLSTKTFLWKKRKKKFQRDYLFYFNVSFTLLDEDSEMIIFESILTTFEIAPFFTASSSKNWLELIIEPS
jgi:hypothetical protein